MRKLFSFFIFISYLMETQANYDHFGSQELDLAASLWLNDPPNSSHNEILRCAHCEEIFYPEPPPDDILFLPGPPMHPSFQNSIEAELINLAKQQQSKVDQCSFCSLIYESNEFTSSGGVNEGIGARFVPGIVLVCIILTVYLYMMLARKSKVVSSLAKSTFFKSPNQNLDNTYNATLDRTMASSGGHLTDPCYLQTNRDKDLMSPIINDHISHKKTAIPSKCWAQPGSIIGRNLGRTPNEYEMPSSHTNSTRTSTYADVNQCTDRRFVSPYNSHIYAEVHEVAESANQMHNDSNSSAVMSDACHQENALYPQNNNCIETMAQGSRISSVQMADFSLVQHIAPATCGQFNNDNMNMYNRNQQRIPSSHDSKSLQHTNRGAPVVQSIYERPPPRAQIIVTTSGQGQVNPTLISYGGRINNVI